MNFKTSLTYIIQNKFMLPISNSNGLFGFINSVGDIVIAPKFYDVGLFSPQGLALVRIDQWAECGIGYIDLLGNVVIGQKFYNGDGFTQSGLAHVIFDKTSYFLHGYIDTKGNTAIEPIF
ncbi:MAG: WG repeat-containing protein [Methylococcaceae bacterium]